MSEPIDVQYSFFDGEVLAPGAEVKLDLSAKLDRFQDHVFLYRAQRLLPRNAIQENQKIRVPTDGLAPGPYRLVVREQLDAEGNVIVHRSERYFHISALKSKIFEDYRLEQMVQLAVDDTTTKRLFAGDAVPVGSTYLARVKAFRRDNGEPEEFGLDVRGERVDCKSILADVQTHRKNKFGCIHETLFKRLEEASDSDRIDVQIWPHVSENVEEVWKQKPENGEITQSARNFQQQQLMTDVSSSKSSLYKKLKREGVQFRDSEGSSLPVVQASMTASAIRELAKEDVGLLMLDDQTAIPDLGTQIAISRTDGAHALGFTGNGVRVAVFENGPNDTTDLDFQERWTPNPSASPGDNAHSRLTSAIVKNVQANRPHGHAPSCSLYSANSASNTALKWAFDRQCTVISQSFHRGSEPRSPDLSADDMIKDWMASHSPFPTIVQAAGNFWATDPDNIDPPEDEYVNHKGFNTISVGNHNDTATAMSSSSVYRNAGDRELPEIAANGTSVSAVGESMSGTSFAAPAVAGIVACMQEADGTLKYWPEGCRAILFATADRNVHGSNWRANVSARVDGRDGAGAVNARSAVNVARNRRQPNGARVGTAFGFDLRFASDQTVDVNREVVHRYYVKAGGLLAFGVYTIKVALAWTVPVSGSFDSPGTSSLAVDLDLHVRNLDGSTVAVSSTFANSYEIVEFAAVRGRTYVVVVRRFSGTVTVPFGLAWNTTFRLPGPINPLPASL